MADGVLGEFQYANVTVGPGTEIDLGELDWTPARHGAQVWEIGIPNRTGSEFLAGDRFFEPDILREYPELFPDDVVYTVGESDPREDWFFAHVPRGPDSATDYAIRFDLDAVPDGEAVLRLAISGTGTRSIDVGVNGEPASSTTI